MKMGTKSILLGAHAFWLHPWFVARAWWKLFGFPWDPRLWVAFFIHDLGYWGMEHMDDAMGELHPLWGATIMHKLFDGEIVTHGPNMETIWVRDERWFNFTLYHSRFLSKQRDVEPSLLCFADKLAIALTPWWLYLPMVRLTGEIKEYQRSVKHVEDLGFAWKGNSWKEDRGWFQMLQQRMRDFVQHEVDQWPKRLSA